MSTELAVMFLIEIGQDIYILLKFQRTFTVEVWV